MAKISASTNIDNIQIQEQAGAPTTPASGYGRIYCKSDGLYFIGDGGVEVGPLTGGTAGTGYTQGARVYNDAAIAIGTASDTALTFNTERYDTDTIHDTSTNTSRLTCKTAGKYIITGHVEFAAHATGMRFVYIRFGGTTDIARVGDVEVVNQVPRYSISTIYHLEIDEYVELMVYQNSGGNLNVNATANRSPEFAMQRIG